MKNISHMNEVEQERYLLHEIKQERDPRARKRLGKRLKALRKVTVPDFKLVK